MRSLVRSASWPTGTLLVALGASLWGTDTLLRQPLTASLSSASIVFFEHVILTGVLLPVLVRRRRAWGTLGPRQWAAVAWIAWGGSALGTICYTHAIKLGNPTTVIFLQKLQPLFAVMLARLLLGETALLRRRFWLKLAVAMLAAYVISFGGEWVLPARLDVRSSSAGLALAAAFIWGSCTVVGRYVLPHVSVTDLTALRVAGALPLLAALVLSGEPHARWPTVNQAQLGPLVLLALIPGLLGLLTYYRGLRETQASVATLAELCFPASAAILNWTFLGAEVTAAQVVGVLVLWAAVLWKD